LGKDKIRAPILRGRGLSTEQLDDRVHVETVDAIEHLDDEMCEFIEKQWPSTT